MHLQCDENEKAKLPQKILGGFRKRFVTFILFNFGYFKRGPGENVSFVFLLNIALLGS